MTSVLTEWARIEPRQGYIDEDAVSRQAKLAVPVLPLLITDACAEESSKISSYTPSQTVIVHAGSLKYLNAW